MKEKKKLKDKIRDAEPEIILLFIGYTVLPLFAALLLIYDAKASVSMSCGLRELAGLYCPGCGGTRALWSFITGHFLASFYYHPFVPFALVMYVIYMVRNTLYLIKPRKYEMMEFKSEYAIIALIVILVQFIFKNAMIIGFGIYMV